MQDVRRNYQRPLSVPVSVVKKVGSVTASDPESFLDRDVPAKFPVWQYWIIKVGVYAKTPKPMRHSLKELSIIWLMHLCLDDMFEHETISRPDFLELSEYLALNYQFLPLSVTNALSFEVIDSAGEVSIDWWDEGYSPLAYSVYLLCNEYFGHKK